MSITISGLGSGLDVDALIDGLVGAQKAPLTRLQAKKDTIEKASAALGGISTKLSALRTAASDLADPLRFSSYSVKSGDTSVVASVTGAASAGSYDIQVTSLAREQRTYSSTQTSSTDALAMGGNLSIQVGDGAAASISIDAGDSLADIATKISSSGARVAASVLYDGSSYRLQVRGLDTGSANAVTFTESGFDLGLGDPANTFQQAQNATLVVDGISVSRSTNQIVGVVPGVTLALTKTTTTPTTVTVAADPDGLATKIGTFVKAYNDVVSAGHFAAGFGSIKPQQTELAGDGVIRGALDKLSRIIGSVVPGASGKYQTLGSVGLQSNSDGSLKLDTTKLNAALNADPASVARLFVVDAATGATGAMGSLKTAIGDMTTGKNATFRNRIDALDARARRLDTDAENIQRQLDAYAAQLRTRYAALEKTVAYQRTQGASLPTSTSSE